MESRLVRGFEGEHPCLALFNEERNSVIGVRASCLTFQNVAYCSKTPGLVIIIAAHKVTLD